jgi:hypothetical protein
VHITKAYGEIKAFLTLEPHGSDVQLHALPALPLRKTTLDHSFNRMIGWTQNQSGYFREEINLMSIRNEPQFLGHPAHNLVIKPTINYPGS